MLRDDMTLMSYRIRFLDNDVERTHYSDDRRYFEQLIAQHGHLSDLRIDTVTLTPEQQQRLGAIKGAGLSAHDAAVYVQYGTTESDDTAFFDADKLVNYQRAQAEPQVKARRKKAEALGVTVNGIRYSGDPSNRAALLEVVQFAREAQLATLASWKDSDNQFHPNHPVADVEQALQAIAHRRGSLIALEGQYAAQLQAGEIDSIEGLSWEV